MQGGGAGGAPSCGRRGRAAPWDAAAERGNAALSSPGTRRQRGGVGTPNLPAPPASPRPGPGPPTRRGTNPGVAGGGAGRAGNGASGPAPPDPSSPAPLGSSGGRGSGGAGGHPLTFPGLSWTAAFPPALCLLGRPALPSCVPPGAGGRCAPGRRGAAAPESPTGLRWPRALLRSAPPPPRTQRGHTGRAGTAHTGCTRAMRAAVQARGAVDAGCAQGRLPPTAPSPRAQRRTRRPPSLWPRPFEVGETSCPELLWPDLSAPRASLAHKSFGAGGVGAVSPGPAEGTAGPRAAVRAARCPGTRSVRGQLLRGVRGDPSCPPLRDPGHGRGLSAPGTGQAGGQ